MIWHINEGVVIEKFIVEERSEQLNLKADIKELVS